MVTPSPQLRIDAWPKGYPEAISQAPGSLTFSAPRHDRGLVTEANRPYWEAAIIIGLICLAIWAGRRKK